MSRDSNEVSDRNPSPPSEEFANGNGELLRGDSIGDTVFSKHWVFTSLMTLLKAVENEDEGKTDGEKEAANLSGIEIDSDLENDLCKLWDMTANEDVSLFLQEWKSPDMLLSVIAKTNAPRVTEICMGILGNMVCTGSISKSLSENDNLVTLTLSMLSGRDPPTLVETCRFLNTALSHPGSANRWLTFIKEDEEVFQNLAFILQSSTNIDLLHNTVDLIDLILDSSDEITEKWSSPSLIDGLVEAFKQARSERKSTLSVILHTIQLISVTSLGIDCLVKMNETIMPILAQYISDICEEEVIAIKDQKRALASSIIVVNSLLRDEDKVSKILFIDSTSKKLLKNLLKLFQVAQRDYKRELSQNSGAILDNDVDGNSNNASKENETNPVAVITGDCESSHNASEGTAVDSTTQLLLSSLTSFARLLLDLSVQNEDVQEALQDKFEEGKDITCLELLRELLDST
ncbi:protein saal1-like [Apostichopus japonicus]|uniref:protein saal1-like n=1 Tax=Stichopus japonicus TaxID=307972 RepID=UPI003AB4106B